MIKYGLKLWSHNIDWFGEAVERFDNGEFDVVEVYSNSEIAPDYDALSLLKPLPVQGIHIGHLDKVGFHTFFLQDDQVPAWKQTVALADYFSAEYIIVHPAVEHTRETFWQELGKMDDPRILVENMPIVSPLGGPDRMFGASLEDMKHIVARKQMCFDISKAIKAAVYYDIPYKQFLSDALAIMQPPYIHISGCTLDNPVDQHLDLREATFDVAWVRSLLEDYAQNKDVPLIFETPKNGSNLDQDMANMHYFRII